MAMDLEQPHLLRRALRLGAGPGPRPHRRRRAAIAGYLGRRRRVRPRDRRVRRELRGRQRAGSRRAASTPSRQVACRPAANSAANRGRVEVAAAEVRPCRVPTRGGRSLRPQGFHQHDLRDSEGDMTPRRSRGRRLVLVAVAAVALVLAACSEVKNNGQNSLEPKGPQAQKIYDLFVPILIIAIVVGIAIIVATVFLAVKFRYKKGSNENPKQVHGNTPPRDRVDGPPRAAARDHRGAHRRHHLRPRREPGPAGAAGHRRGQAVVVAVLVPRRQGRHRRRDGHPDRPRRLRAAHTPATAAARPRPAT